jgi:S-adenosyl methyltransferase
MSHPALAASETDRQAPYPFRVYSCWLGGKDRGLADREAVGEVMRLRPEVVAGARANRASADGSPGTRPTDAGIRQFLDIGCAWRGACRPRRHQPQVATRGGPLSRPCRA